MESKYKSLTDWSKADPKAYNHAYRNGLLKVICDKFNWRPPNKIYWTFERCKEEALKYNIKSYWISSCSSSYKIAKKNGWLAECCAHMKTRKPAGYWTKERVLAEALKYETKTDWYKNSGSSHGAAHINGWYEECVAHMKLK